MKRIKIMGSAIAMALTLTAMIGAASASAAGFVAGSYPASLKATPATTHLISTNFGTIPCEGPVFQAGLSVPSEAISSSVQDSTCSAYGTGGAWKMNKCSLSFHPGKEVAAGKFEGTFAIGPVGCGPVRIETITCTITIPAQSGLKATFENVGSAVRIKPEVTTMQYTQSCGASGTHTNGGWTGSWDLTANNGGTSVAVRSTGIMLAGFESANPALQPRLQAERPAYLFGELNSAHRFTTRAGSATCREARFNSAMETVTKQLFVQADYGKCNIWGFISNAVEMNSCSYKFRIANAGPPYTGSADIVCSEGDAIEFAPPGCTTTIGPQSPSSSVTYQNEGAGTERRVKVTVALSNITYNECGTVVSDGTYEGVFTLRGV